MLERALDGVEERLFTRRVALGALESSSLRPATVAVHHDRDVSRYARKIDPVSHRRARYRPVREGAFATIRRRAPNRRAARALDGDRESDGRSGRTRRLLPGFDALGARGVPVQVSSDADDGRALARTAIEAGSGIIACGGDGTVAALAGVAAETDGVLAVVPSGAGNDFARHIGLDDHEPLDALELLATGRVATVDLGERTSADGTTAWCTTVANTGFDAEANRWANGVRLLTGTPLYVAAVLRTAVTYRPQPIVVRVDGIEWRGRAWLVAVGNTRCYASGMVITPGAAIDDGLLDVCVIGDVPFAKFLLRFPRSSAARTCTSTAWRCSGVDASSSRLTGAPRRSSSGRAAIASARCPVRWRWCRQPFGCSCRRARRQTGVITRP